MVESITEGVCRLTRSEYDKLVEEIVAAERESLENSLNAIFDQMGRSPDAFTHMISRIVENQAVAAARIVTGVLGGLGILPNDV